MVSYHLPKLGAVQFRTTIRSCQLGALEASSLEHWKSPGWHSHSEVRHHFPSYDDSCYITIAAWVKGRIIVLLARKLFFPGSLSHIVTYHYCWKIWDWVCNWIGSRCWSIGNLQMGYSGFRECNLEGLRGCSSGSSGRNSGNLGFRECYCSLVRVIWTHTVLIHSIHQSHVTGLPKLMKSHDCHGHFGKVTKPFSDSKNLFKT